MKKSCLIAAGLAVLVVFGCILGVGGWWFWRSYVRSPATPVVGPASSTMREPGSRSELPGVEMSVHSAADGVAFTGWPLFVRVSVRCPVSAQSQEPKPITITGASGSWQESLRLVVKDDSGTSVQWPWRQPKAEQSPMTLDGQSGLEWVWWLTGQESQAIPAGKYNLTVMLDTSAVSVAGAWKGTASSRPAALTFQPASRLSAKQEALREIHTARAEALGGDNAGAIARLQALIERSPGNIEALTFCAALLSDTGKLRESLALYNRAVGAWYEAHPNAATDPVLLLKEQRRLRNRLLEQER